MSTERYDESVREQKKIKREKQIRNQKVVLGFVILAVIIGALFALMTYWEKSSGEDTDAQIRQAVASGYQKFLEANSAQGSAEEIKEDSEQFAAWLAETYPDETKAVFQSGEGGTGVSEADFYAGYNKTLHVLSDEYHGYLKDTDTAAGNHIYVKDGKSEGEAEIVIGGNLVLSEDELALERYDETGVLSDSISQEVLDTANAADLFFLSHEYTASSQEEALDGKPVVFRADPNREELLLELGVDLVSLANDHVYDYGADALLDTIAGLDERGINHIGAGADSAEASQPVYYIINGVKIGFAAAMNSEAEGERYTEQAGEDTAGVQTAYDIEAYKKILSDAAKNCDYLIAYMHWGPDNENQLDDAQQSTGAELIQAGADLVIGGNSRKLQGVEFVDSKPVVYGMGDFWARADRKFGGLLKLNITADGLKQMAFVPCLDEDFNVQYLSDSEQQRTMYDALQELSPNAVIDDQGVITEDTADTSDADASNTEAQPAQ